MPKRPFSPSAPSPPPPPPQLLHRLPVPIPRKRYFDENFTLDQLISKIHSSSGNVVVLVGAGISTSCGIKDFRSPGSGIYSQIAVSEHPLLSTIGEPQEVFNFETFIEEPEIFYAAAPLVLSSLLHQSTLPSLTHRFISQLEGQGKLLTCFTQNIDGLESEAGLSISKIVQCHGDLKSASCLKCSSSVPLEEILPIAMTGAVPLCKRQQILKRTTTKKSISNSYCGGVMKPSFIFFSEPLPSLLFTTLQDVAKSADVLLVIGTSLNVSPINKLPRMVKSDTPVVLINKERLLSSLKSVEFDLELIGDADVIVELIMNRLGWANGSSDIKITKSSSVSSVYIVSKPSS
jgi:NAD-dependent histone deacetylase SIR2